MGIKRVSVLEVGIVLYVDRVVNTDIDRGWNIHSSGTGDRDNDVDKG